MKRILQNSIAIAVVIIVLFIIVPLPTQLLDVLLVVNISLSMLILVITMTISDALDFSIFPSLLLITTLFRLGLNVSTTRQILGRNGDAGNVILSFGTMITQGNIVLGVIIFLIIVLVQMIVVTKGAERVSEVAARFTLDAMPGKQMAIDADLSSGLIDEQGAKIRRAKIQSEADFYGAMDGATKFVKGDATMSIIITAINFIGGLILGVSMGGMDMSTALSTYSIATIGDGLVSQIPSLMISTATAMIVTRSVSDGSLNDDVVGQFSNQPRAIFTAGMVISLLGLIPGTPHAALLFVGIGLIAAGWWMSSRLERKQAAALAAETAAAACDTLHLFLVSEDASLVPFSVRKELARAGTAHLDNVALHDSGPYIISSATFPSYFLEDEAAVIDGHARLDLAVFVRIARALDITVRYVGEEPASQVTGIYNQVMASQLPRAGIDCVIVPRLAVSDEAVSASTVRMLIQQGRLEEIRPLVPESTYRFFLSPEGEPVVQAIRAAGEDQVTHY